MNALKRLQITNLMEELVYKLGEDNLTPDDMMKLAVDFAVRMGIRAEQITGNKNLITELLTKIAMKWKFLKNKKGN